MWCIINCFLSIEYNIKYTNSYIYYTTNSQSAIIKSSLYSVFFWPVWRKSYTVCSTAIEHEEIVGTLRKKYLNLALLIYLLIIKIN